MNAKFIFLPKRDLNYISTEARIKRRLVKKKGWIFLGLSVGENPYRHDLPPLLTQILCSSPPYVHNLFSVFFLERLCISFSLSSRLDSRLFTYGSSCSLSHPSRRILPFLAFFLTCVFFSTSFTPFTSCILGRSLAFFPAYFHSKPSLYELELYQFPPVDKALALAIISLFELIRNCKILRITVQLQPHQFDFPLKTGVTKYLPTRLHNH